MSQVQEKINNSSERGLITYDPPAPSANQLIPQQKNKDRNKVEKALHSEIAITEEVQKNAKFAKDMLITNPTNSVASIVKGGISKIKNVMSDLESPGVSANALRFKKYGLLALSAGFGLVTLKSFSGLLKSLWARDDSSKVIKLADIFLKFIMTLGIGGAALGKGSFQFKNMGAIVGGTVLSVLLSQFKGVDSGDKNILGKVAKLTGSEQTLKEGLRAASGLRTD
jgi:hypothetical protein